MGILDRLLGRKSQVAAEEVATGDLTAESATADEAETEPAVAEENAAEAVEIPKQQSADVAADSEAAGEGART